jgi:predicted nucleic acid-binding protein
MIVLGSNLLSDYLDGKEPARQFLQRHEQETWVISAIVLYEAQMGCVCGYLDADPGTVRQAIPAAVEILKVSEQTTEEATTLPGHPQPARGSVENPRVRKPPS